MRLFRNPSREGPVATLLRHLEHDRFDEAFRALKAWREGPAPPPHALWRLGRALLEKGRPKRARVVLQAFVDLYPAHRDRPTVVRDLALALKRAGREAEARLFMG